jgi:TonB family protein
VGLLKAQNTLTIAVWGSILLHTATFLGFELAFSKTSESFPKSEPRTITVVSISKTSGFVSSREKVVQNDNVETQKIEKIISEELVSIEREFPVEITEEKILPEVIEANGNTNNQEVNFLPVLDSTEPSISGLREEILSINEPVPIKGIEPEYPFRARKKGLEGVVILFVTISKAGVPLSCNITDSSGYKDLDNAAKETVLSSLFQPGTLNGEDIESTLRISISFQLN